MRYSKRRTTPGPRTKTKDKIIKPEGLALTHYPTYDNLFRTTGDNNNQLQLDKEIDDYLKNAIEEFTVETPTSRTFAGITPVELDGAIQAITFTVDANGARTTVHRNHDPGSPVSLSFAVKRDLERNKAARDAKAIFGPDAVARLGKVGGL
jgi:hypothetical protein